MSRSLPRILFFIALVFLLLPGCKRGFKADVSDIEASVSLERFDRQLFGVKADSLEGAIAGLYREYGDFYDVFNVHVINIGDASTRLYPSYLSMFINDPTNREVFEYTDRVFNEKSVLNDQLEMGFRHYLYHYPDSRLYRG